MHGAQLPDCSYCHEQGVIVKELICSNYHWGIIAVMAERRKWTLSGGPIKGHYSWVCHGPVALSAKRDRHPSLQQGLNRGEGQRGASHLHPSSHFWNADLNSERGQHVWVLSLLMFRVGVSYCRQQGWVWYLSSFLVLIQMDWNDHL